MNGRLEQKNALHIVGIKVVAPPQRLGELVPQAWLDLTAALDSISGQVDPDLFYGVFPESDHLRNGPGDPFTYLVGVQVSAFGQVPAGMETLTIPAQRYAVITCQGTRQRIPEAYMAIDRWIREQGLRTNGDSYGFELYDRRRQSPAPPYERFDYDIYRPLN